MKDICTPVRSTRTLLGKNFYSVDASHTKVPVSN
jgi:hypothetical protein